MKKRNVFRMRIEKLRQRLIKPALYQCHVASDFGERRHLEVAGFVTVFPSFGQALKRIETVDRCIHLPGNVIDRAARKNAEFQVKTRSKSGSVDDIHGPQSAGIPGGVRMTYVPESEPILVHDLEAGTEYRAAYFDPVTGARNELGLLRADNAGAWSCPPPPGLDHDWVVVIEPTAHDSAVGAGSNGRHSGSGTNSYNSPTHAP